MWQAVLDCDHRHDGLFFYGVRTTGVFCYPSCRAKPPQRANTVYFTSAASAIATGYRPCKRCRPDLPPAYDYLTLVQEAETLLRTGHVEDLTHIAKQLGVSKNHLTRLFRQYTGLTPKAYVTKLRVAQALHLLEQTDKSITDIAFSVGFRSMAAFYRCFLVHTGKKPGDFRKAD